MQDENNVFVSLLYPDPESAGRALKGEDRPDIDEETLKELGFSEILELRNSNLSDYFTTDANVIAYRQSVFRDLLTHPELPALLLKAIPILTDIVEIRRMGSESFVGADNSLNSITEVELYTSCLELLSEGFKKIGGNYESEAFRRMEARILELTESEYYRNINEKLNELTSRVREIRSVTIGVNLDAQLRPERAGVLAVNNQPFRSGELLEKILRLDFKRNEYTCIASLVPFRKEDSDNREQALNNAFYGALNDVFRTSIRAWRRVVQDYVLENTDFLLRLMPEIEFAVKATELMKKLEEKGNPLCFPKVHPIEEKAFCVHGIYNPTVASKVDDEMVLNDFVFDNEGTIYVLTGPNRGGKSVITCAVGMTFVMAQLGLMVPAKEAEISPADGVFTHFPTGSEDTIDKGRLGEECARLDQIFGKISEYSLILLDESLSSTGSFEGAYIAAEVLSGISMAKCRCIFSTHLHELASSLSEINDRCVPEGGARIDTLVAGIEEGRRSFRIVRAKPDGKSYARDIAGKYGLSFEHIMERIRTPRK